MHKIVKHNEIRELVKERDVVEKNFGEIGINYGQINENYGVVIINRGEIEKNYKNAVVKQNYGKVNINEGTIKRDHNKRESSQLVSSSSRSNIKVESSFFINNKYIDIPPNSNITINDDGVFVSTNQNRKS